MKRQFLIVLLSIVCTFCLAFGLAACDNGTTNGGTTNTEQSGGTTDDGTTDDEQGDDQGDEQGDQSGDVEVTVSLNYTQSGSGYIVSDIGNVESDTVTIPSTYNGLPVTGIAANAFSGNTVIVVIVIPESVTSIGNSAFSGCTSLTEVNIPEKVTAIGDNAFNGCTKLESVTLGSGVQSIGSGAFSGCTSLTVIVIGNGVTSIGANAFSGCTKLNNITIGSGVQSIGASAFSGCAITELNVPAGVTSIGANAFADCTKIVVIVILGNATISSGAFSGCTSLMTLTLADGLIASLYDILEAAFANSSLLTEVKDVSGNTYHAHRLTHNAKVEATCTTAGTAENWYCSACDKYYSNSNGTTEVSKDSLTIAATNHTYTYKYDENGHWQECTVCGDKTASENHTLENNICTVCGYKQLVASENLAYTISDDGTYYTVSGIGECTDTDVVIPSTYNGKSVTAIAESAFDNRSWLKSVYIPDSITAIGDYAFMACTALESVTLSNGVTTIGEGAFIFTAIESVTIPDSVTTIGDLAFALCYSLTSINVSSGNTAYKTVDGNLYSYDGTNLIQYALGKTETSFTIPDSVTAIGYGAFAYCSLESVTIPDSVTTIGEGAFCGTAIESITIPDSVTTIGYGAFYNCTALTSVTIGNGVTSIGDSAFEECTVLESVAILGNPAIGDYAFNGCTSISDVTLSDELLAKLSEILSEVFADSSLITEVKDTAGVTYHAHALTYNAKVEATCTAEGMAENWYCSICDKYYSNSNGTIEVSKDSLTIAATNHNIVQAAAQAATCTEVGWNAYEYCTNCDYTTYEEIAATGHTLVQVAAQAATCTEKGWNAYEYCTNCDYTTYEEIPATGHTYTYKYDDNGHWQECTVCGDITASESHTLENNICTVCGYEYIAASVGLDYTISDDGTYYTVIGIGECADTDVVIPSTYNGKSVTAIAASAFKNQTQLTSVYVPDSVTSIGLGAFSGCSSLVSMTLPFVGGSIKTESDTWQYPFGYIFGTTSYTGGTKTTQYYYGSIIGSYTNTTYYIPTTLTTVTITGGNMLCGAFQNCTSLESITIPNSVTSIDVWAFYNCTALESIIIPNSVLSIGLSAFYNCTALKSITIPDSVTTIVGYAFYKCTALTSITIPDSVISIGDYAFGYCTALESVTIGSGVTSIGNSAFYGCSKLTSVTFENTSGWYVSTSSSATRGTDITSSNLSTASTAATYLKSTYCSYYWYRSES